MFNSRRKGKHVISSEKRPAQAQSALASSKYMESYAYLLTLGGNYRSANTKYIPGAYGFSYESCNMAKERTAEAERPLKHDHIVPRHAK